VEIASAISYGATESAIVGYPTMAASATGGSVIATSMTIGISVVIAEDGVAVINGVDGESCSNIISRQPNVEEELRDATN